MLSVHGERGFVSLLFWVGFTAILLGYLMVWLPQPVVGLSLIGLEMGEWVKFLPEMQAGILPNRNLFYLPPVLLGMMMVLWTAGWRNDRWKTWAIRGIAVIVSLLAFPAIESIRFEPISEWLLRIGLIGLVGGAAVLIHFLDRYSFKISFSFLLLMAFLGLILPTWAYLAIRPAIANLLQSEVGFGTGLLFHIGGNMMIVVAVLLLLRPNFFKENQ